MTEEEYKLKLKQACEKFVEEFQKNITLEIVENIKRAKEEALIQQEIDSIKLPPDEVLEKRKPPSSWYEEDFSGLL